jgi:hypothetical protein
MPRFLKRIVLVALVTTFFVALLAGVCMELSYAHHMASNPQPQIGKVIRMTVNHRSVIADQLDIVRAAGRWFIFWGERGQFTIPFLANCNVCSFLGLFLPARTFSMS